MLNLSALSLRGFALVLALAAGLATVGDASALSRKDKRTVVGAVVGGVAGHLISNGDPAATVGGAVAGGAIGNLTTRDNRDHRYDRYDRRHDNGRYNDRGYRNGRYNNDRRYGYDRGQDRRDDRARWDREQRDRRNWNHQRGRGW